MIGFEYDLEGNLTETTLPNGVVTTNSYDNADRMVHTSSVNGATTLQDFTYVYDDAGNRISSTDRNNDQTTYVYDDLGRLTAFDPPGDTSGQLRLRQRRQPDLGRRRPATTSTPSTNSSTTRQAMPTATTPPGA